MVAGTWQVIPFSSPRMSGSDLRPELARCTTSDNTSQTAREHMRSRSHSCRHSSFPAHQHLITPRGRWRSFLVRRGKSYYNLSDTLQTALTTDTTTLNLTSYLSINTRHLWYTHQYTNLITNGHGLRQRDCEPLPGLPGQDERQGYRSQRVSHTHSQIAVTR